MNRLLQLLCVLGALLSSSGLVQSLTIPASEDTTSSQKQIADDANSAALVTVDATHTGFLYFNLDDIPKGTAIRLARLRVYLPGITAKGNGISVHLVKGQWNETVAGTEPKYDATPIGKMEAANLGSRRFVSVDVTAVVQDWISQKAVNEGFALVSVPAGSATVAAASVTIAAKEGINAGLPAHLEIELADEIKVGPAGPAGAQGLKGDSGVNGKSVLSGPVAPTGSSGAPGDLYLNTLTGGLYGPKTSSGWGTARSLVGPKGDAGPMGLPGPKGETGAVGVQGPKGATGVAGAAGPTGAKGPIGPTGAKGDTGPAGASGGRTILSGTVVPGTGTGGIGDFYLNTVTTALYGPKTDTGWGSPKPLVGPVGAQGLTGPRGQTILGGSVSPSSANGEIGDFYLNTTTSALSGPKTATDWGTPKSLVGPAGAPGVQGAPGASGKTILSGISAPSANSGGVGDFFIDTVAFALYGPKKASDWGTAKSLVGPAGPKGEKGDAGQVVSIGTGSITADKLSASAVKSIVDAAVKAAVEAIKPLIPGTVSTPEGMVSVLGGTLPEGSELQGQVVPDFLIGKYEVTWGEWKTVRVWALAHGYSDLLNVGAGVADNHPVTDVSWLDAVKWCNARSEKEGKTPVYKVSGLTFQIGQSTPTVNDSANGYRLPTEAEWEWVARGGAQTKGYTYSGSNDLSVVAWTSINSNESTKGAGMLAANELGIYDMSGNVLEWCWDIYTYTTDRRNRGGCWGYGSLAAAVAYRGGFNSPDVRHASLGFRIACSFGL